MHWLAAPDGIADADPRVAATAMNLGVERCVASCPTQYQWTYRRFRKRPGGLPSPYRR
jgi:KDO2-lipid IV(A) lauroyltransferase